MTTSYFILFIFTITLLGRDLYYHLTDEETEALQRGDLAIMC